MNNVGPTQHVSEVTHAAKYRTEGESFREMVNRLVYTLHDDQEHFHRLREVLLNMRFLPAGRIQAAIGATRSVTAINCFVSGIIEDNYTTQDGIMERAVEAAQTMRMGGGIGYDFSTLRPRGDLIRSLQSRSSGPISFMEIYDAVCRCTSSAGHRRGAQMGVLRVDHPDIEEFIRAKQNTDKLTGFNISIGVTDEFMRAVKSGTSFDLRWEGRVYKTVDAKILWETIMRSTWDWAEPGVIFLDTVNRMNNLSYCEKIVATNPCFAPNTMITTRTGVYEIQELVGKTVEIWDGFAWRIVDDFRVTGRNQKTIEIGLQNGSSIRVTPYHKMILENNKVVEAKDLHIGDKLMVSLVESHGDKRETDSGDWSEPLRQVVSINEGPVEDVVYCCTVPITHQLQIGVGVLTGQCGEQPLPPYGACLLGSFNLTKYMRTSSYGLSFDWEQFKWDIPVVVRAMDNVVESTYYPLPRQEREEKSKRRMGLGITGLANAAEGLGFMYGSDGFVEFTESVLSILRKYAYEASAGLAMEKGPFALFERDRYCESPFVKRLPSETQEMIYKYGIRNSHLLSIAPTGTISLCADNISSGIEPVIEHEAQRMVVEFDGPKLYPVIDYGYRVFGVKGKRANDCSIDDHLRVFIAASQYVDSAVSKTCNVSPTISWEDFKNVYFRAWEAGCKGCTTFNPEGKRMGIFQPRSEENVEGGTREGQSCTIDPVSGRIDCDV